MSFARRAPSTADAEGEIANPDHLRDIAFQRFIHEKSSPSSKALLFVENGCPSEWISSPEVSTELLLKLTKDKENNDSRIPIKAMNWVRCELLLRNEKATQHIQMEQIPPKNIFEDWLENHHQLPPPENLGKIRVRYYPPKPFVNSNAIPNRIFAAFDRSASQSQDSNNGATLAGMVPTLIDHFSGTDVIGFRIGSKSFGSEGTDIFGDIWWHMVSSIDNAAAAGVDFPLPPDAQALYSKLKKLQKELPEIPHYSSWYEEVANEIMQLMRSPVLQKYSFSGPTPYQAVVDAAQSAATHGGTLLMLMDGDVGRGGDLRYSSGKEAVVEEIRNILLSQPNNGINGIVVLFPAHATDEVVDYFREMIREVVKMTCDDNSPIFVRIFPKADPRDMQTICNNIRSIPLSMAAAPASPGTFHLIHGNNVVTLPNNQTPRKRAMSWINEIKASPPDGLSDEFRLGLRSVVGFLVDKLESICLDDLGVLKIELGRKVGEILITLFSAENMLREEKELQAAAGKKPSAPIEDALNIIKMGTSALGRVTLQLGANIPKYHEEFVQTMGVLKGDIEKITRLAGRGCVHESCVVRAKIPYDISCSFQDEVMRYELLKGFQLDIACAPELVGDIQKEIDAILKVTPHKTLAFIGLPSSNNTKSSLYKVVQKLRQGEWANHHIRPPNGDDAGHEGMMRLYQALSSDQKVASRLALLQIRLLPTTTGFPIALSECSALSFAISTMMNPSQDPANVALSKIAIQYLRGVDGDDILPKWSLNEDGDIVAVMQDDDNDPRRWELITRLCQQDPQMAELFRRHRPIGNIVVAAQRDNEVELGIIPNDSDTASIIPTGEWVEKKQFIRHITITAIRKMCAGKRWQFALSRKIAVKSHVSFHETHHRLHEPGDIPYESFVLVNNVVCHSGIVAPEVLANARAINGVLHCSIQLKEATELGGKFDADNVMALGRLIRTNKDDNRIVKYASAVRYRILDHQTDSSDFQSAVAEQISRFPGPLLRLGVGGTKPTWVPFDKKVQKDVVVNMKAGELMEMFPCTLAYFGLDHESFKLLYREGRWRKEISLAVASQPSFEQVPLENILESIEEQKLISFKGRVMGSTTLEGRANPQECEYDIKAKIPISLTRSMLLQIGEAINADRFGEACEKIDGEQIPEPPTCMICMDSVYHDMGIDPSAAVQTCARHIICRSCLSGCLSANLSTDDIKPIDCPGRCGPVPIQLIEDFASEESAKYQQRMEAYCAALAIAGDTRSARTLSKGLDKVAKDHLLVVRCTHENCVRARAINRVCAREARAVPCDDCVENNRRQRIIDETPDWEMRCPCCRIYVEHWSGCNFGTCTNCHINFCLCEGCGVPLRNRPGAGIEYDGHFGGHYKKNGPFGRCDGPNSPAVMRDDEVEEYRATSRQLGVEILGDDA